MPSKESHNNIEELKKAHLAAGKRPFYPLANNSQFLPEEKEMLRKYGSWMQALANGGIEPYTAGQEHFIEVAKGRAAPRNQYEEVWIKYQRRMEWEEKEGDRWSRGPMRTCSHGGSSKRLAWTYGYYQLKKHNG